MPAWVVPVLELIVTAAGTTYGAVESSKANKEQQKLAQEQIDAAKQGMKTTPTPPPVTSGAPPPASQQDIARALAQQRNQVGDAGVSPGFYTDVLNSMFPNQQQDVYNTVFNKTSTG